MGRYLQLDNTEVEAAIDTAVDKIVLTLHPRSVMLLGSFGRNEVSFIDYGEKLKFLSDCEISIVCNRYVSRRMLRGLSSAIAQETGLEVALISSLTLLLYSRFRIPSWVLRRIWRPSIVNYEREKGGKVVFGENILESLPKIESADIPLWEGIRLMFNRMVEALKHFPPERQNRDEAIYWINKIVFACQDALLLSIKQYHYSYRTRNLRFQEMFPRHFKELKERLPKFLPLASRATDYKLKATEDAYPEDLTELWFDAAEICDTTFRYIIKQDMNISFDTYQEFQEGYLGNPKVRRNYYLGIIASLVLHNINTLIRMITSTSCRFPPSQLMLKCCLPWRHIIYSVIPLVYFGLSRQGRVNEPDLKQARKVLSLFKRLKPGNEAPLEEWKYIKEQTIDLWQTLC